MSDETDQEDKTEEATQRRIDQAIERGDVPKSAELATFLILASGTLALMVAGIVGSNAFISGMGGMLSNMHMVAIEPQSLTHVGIYSAKHFISIVGIPMLFAVAAGVLSGLMLHKPLWTTETLEPKLDRLSPMAGFKRIFGKEALVQFLKSLAKFSIVSIVIVAVLWPERQKLSALVALDPSVMLDVSWTLSLKLIGGVLAIFAIVAGIDVFYQRYTWLEKLKMTREELKKEYKETEGSPEIKQRIRKLRNESLKKRMMAQVPSASVIITNPTHYAVALKYEAKMNAPVLIAKGVDTLAKKIREVAAEHDIPIVENPPLARALHAHVDLDREIPEEHYKAVAEVIGYVMRLRRGR